MENVTLVGDKKVKKTPPRPLPKLDQEGPSIQAKFLCAGIAACTADLITFPLDTAKVRLQIQGEGATPTNGGSIAQATRKQFKYRGIVGTLCTIAREEGPRACYNGLVPGLQRQMCFASIRIGMYDSVKKTYMNAFQVGNGGGGNVAVRILAGITTGGLAVACAQPTDVVKVRMQAQSGAGPKKYSSCLGAFRTIAKEEGVRGLWKGVSPNIARNAIVNASELVSYDLIKEFILRRKILSDSMPCHFLSAFGAGFCTTVIASPVDVVKTRFMIADANTYNGVVDCAVKMYKQEGMNAFYKGFFPSFMRIASWNILMFVTFEQLKKMVVQFNQKIPEIEVKQEPKRYM